MGKFKVGDKVRCLSTYYSWAKGQPFTVHTIYDNNNVRATPDTPPEEYPNVNDGPVPGVCFAPHEWDLIGSPTKYRVYDCSDDYVSPPFDTLEAAQAHADEQAIEYLGEVYEVLEVVSRRVGKREIVTVVDAP